MIRYWNIIAFIILLIDFEPSKAQESMATPMDAGAFRPVGLKSVCSGTYKYDIPGGGPGNGTSRIICVWQGPVGMKSDSGSYLFELLPVDPDDEVPFWLLNEDLINRIPESTEYITLKPPIPLYSFDVETGIIQDLRPDPLNGACFFSGSDKDFLVLFSDPSIVMPESANIRIYSSGSELHVDFPVSFLNSAGINSCVILYDIQGKKIDSYNTDSLFNTFTVSNLKGVFIVRVISEKEIVTQKLFFE